jgi:hypothetical protein
MYILNAFSVNMLTDFPSAVQFAEVSIDEAKDLAGGATSAVGHADTAAVFSSTLGVQVPMARVNVSLKSGATALLGQYRGPRLPEGATALPAGATIQWLRVTVA